MFFITEKQQKTILNFSLDSLVYQNNINNKTPKILNLLNEAKDSKFATKNGTLSMINQMQIMMWAMKLSIIQKF